jgi:hypothetical protein
MLMASTKTTAPWRSPRTDSNREGASHIVANWSLTVAEKAQGLEGRKPPFVVRTGERGGMNTTR